MLRLQVSEKTIEGLARRAGGRCSRAAGRSNTLRGMRCGPTTCAPTAVDEIGFGVVALVVEDQELGRVAGALLRGSAPDPEVYRSAARMKGWEVLVRVLYESSPQAKNNSMRSCYHVFTSW